MGGGAVEAEGAGRLQRCVPELMYPGLPMVGVDFHEVQFKLGQCQKVVGRDTRHQSTLGAQDPYGWREFLSFDDAKTNQNRTGGRSVEYSPRR